MSNPPRTQYNRNITFRLTGGGPPIVFTFPIKPGELQIRTPARTTTTQTLGGVYQDFGGSGVQTIQIQGNTGWRRTTNGADNNGMDGFESMRMLYQKIYLGYLDRVSKSVDPTDIELFLIDDIYDTVYRVSIDDFQASKSKSSPLLYNYSIPMTVQNIRANKRGASDLEQLPSVALDANYIPVSLSLALGSVKSYTDTNNYRLYTTQSGDTLESISYSYFQTTLRRLQIAALNGIASPYILNIGYILRIPW